MNNVIYVCDKCGRQCTDDQKKNDHINITSHKTFTLVPGYNATIKKVSMDATVIDITDEVLDKIADRVLKKLRELEFSLELDI